MQISALGERAEAAAAQVDLEAAWHFQKARRVTREALIADGIAGEIDAAVEDLTAAMPT